MPMQKNPFVGGKYASTQGAVTVTAWRLERSSREQEQRRINSFSSSSFFLHIHLHILSIPSSSPRHHLAVTPVGTLLPIEGADDAGVKCWGFYPFDDGVDDYFDPTVRQSVAVIIILIVIVNLYQLYFCN